MRTTLFQVEHMYLGIGITAFPLGQGAGKYEESSQQCPDCRLGIE